MQHELSSPYTHTGQRALSSSTLGNRSSAHLSTLTENELCLVSGYPYPWYTEFPKTALQPGGLSETIASTQLALDNEDYDMLNTETSLKRPSGKENADATPLMKRVRRSSRKGKGKAGAS